MPTKVFYLDDAQQDPVTINWGLFWKNFTITYDGQVVGQLSGTKALEQGATFPLPTGSQLTVQLVRKFLVSQGLNVLVDGRVLPGSHTHPQEQFKQGYQALLLIAGLHVGLGILALFPGLDMLREIGLGVGTVLTGLVYAGLATWAKRGTSPLAFQIALALFIIDFLAGIVLAEGGRSNPGAGAVFRLFMGALLYGGAQGAKALRTQAQLISAQQSE